MSGDRACVGVTGGDALADGDGSVEGDGPEVERNALGQPVGRLLADWVPRPRPAREALVGRWCRLEPLDPARHAEDLFLAFADDRSGAMWTYLSTGPYPDLDSYRAWAEWADDQGDPLHFAVLDGSGRARGTLAFLRIVEEMGSIEIGFLTFSPSLQRSTVATEAVVLLLRHAFETLGYRRCEWKCNALNERSRRAATRLGFTYEGTFRQAVVVKQRNRDTAWYAILDREWPRLAAAYDTWLAPENFDDAGVQRVALSSLTRPGAAAGTL